MRGDAEETAPVLPYESARDGAVAAEVAVPDVPIEPSSRKLVTAACMLVMVLSSMEMTITSTAMPTIIGDLHGLEHYAWVASLYLLTCTVSMPLYGRLADSLGRKKVLLTSIAVFLLASLLASTAQSMTTLVIYRGLQGLGAGGIMPTVLTVLGDIFTLKERAGIQGLFSAIWGTASLGGPALGALLVNTLGWRAIFFVNLPPGLIAMFVLWRYYQDVHRTDVKRSLLHHVDLPGFLTLSTATSTLLVAVSIPFHSWITIPLIVASAIAAVLFVYVERRTDEPLLSPELLARRDVWPVLIASGLVGVGFLSLDTYVPLFVQGGRGGGATAAATVVTPVMLAWACSGMFAAPLVLKWGFRRVAMLGALLLSIGFAGLLLGASLGMPTWTLTATLVITGLGMGPSSMSLLLSVQHSVEYSQRGTATSAVQLIRTLGGALGIGLHGALFAYLAAPGLKSITDRGFAAASMLDEKTVGLLPPDVVAEARHTISHNLLYVFASMLFFALAQLAVSFLIPAAKSDRPVTTGEAVEALAG